jgi:transposase
VKNTALSLIATVKTAFVSCDVSMDTLNLVCPSLARPGFKPEWEIQNGSEAIRATLDSILHLARLSGFEQVNVVVEPTGVYHRLLLRIARALGCQTNLVDASHVVKMREVIFGDPGKSDERDPLAIHAVAMQGRLIVDRQLPEVYRLLRHRSKLYEDAEVAIIDAKSRIHRIMTLLFPDFSFTTDFLYGPSGSAIYRCYGLNPHRIAGLTPARILDRLRKQSRILRSSVTRLLADARQSVETTESGRCNELLEHELDLAWRDLEIACERHQVEREAIEALYEEARQADPRLPSAQTKVISAVALGRFFAETGPLSDYQSWRQVLPMGGLNLCERKSGKYVGQTKISRRGRPRMRTVLNHIALPLVKRSGLFGAYYGRKCEMEKMPGKKAMTAVSRKIVKMLWGWYHSGVAFDAKRVFACEAQYRNAA